MENRAKQKLKEFARQLLIHEATSGRMTNVNHFAAFRVCEKLRLPLSKLMGVAGFYALLSRALAMARSEVAWLQVLSIKPDGSLSDLDPEAKLDTNEIASGEIVLVAELLGLLITFIGPSLTLGLVRQAWPKARLNNSMLETENSNEKDK